VKRIKTFALFESGPTPASAYTATQIRDVFEPYVTFPELYKENFLTWHFITQGWNNYYSYIDYVKPKTPLSREEFERYHNAWSVAENTGGNHLFNQLLGCILRAQIEKLNMWNQDFSPLELKGKTQRPLVICEILYGLLHPERFEGPGWATVK
jgi:hypothetical protein